MIKYFIATILFTLYSCTQDKPSSQINETAIKEKNIPSKIDFTGIWVNEKYLKSLEESKSAKKSQSISSLSLIDIKINEDSTCLWIWNFHEGTSDKYTNLTDSEIKFLNGSKIIFENDSVAFALYGETKEKIVRITSITKNLMKIPEEIIVKTLFDGVFYYGDSQANDHPVIFNLDGTINGFENFHRFNVMFDYLDIGLNDDLISFRGDASEESFIWSFKGDTLYLYKINCASYDSLNNICGEIEKGKIVHKLIRRE